MIIVIDNYKFSCHFETLETLITKYDQIIKKPKSNNDKIYLENIRSKEFIKYITNRYPHIKVNTNLINFDYKIYSTLTHELKPKFKNELNDPKYYFIHHYYDHYLRNNPRVYYLTPLCKRYINPDILPPINKKKMDYPIYVIQGNYTEKRRYYKLLVNILRHKYSKDFKIKLLGKGIFPKILLPYKSKIIIKNNLNFIDYHQSFSDCYCILPLITKKTHIQYYTNQLTSTMIYAKAYNLKCLIDKDLQNIYQLKNVEIFNNENDIYTAFVKTLNNFYTNNVNLANVSK